MYTRHFMNMLIGLIGMAILGFAGLYFINQYSHGQAAQVVQSIQNPTAQTVPVQTVPKGMPIVPKTAKK